jgi:hypothetical protein
VQSFPEPGHKVRISDSGGQFPRWTDGGMTLQYNNAGAVAMVPVTGGEELKLGPPHEAHPNLSGVTGTTPLPDESKWLVSIATDQRPRDIRLILDWTALLGR